MAKEEKKFSNLNKGTSSMSGFDGLINNNQASPVDPIPTEKKATKDINFKDVPVDVHKFLKNRATDEGTTIAKLVLDAVIAHYGLEKD